MPAPLRWFTLMSFILVILYAVLPLMMLMEAGLVKTLILKNEPAISTRDLGFAISAVKIFSVSIHALFIGLTVWLTIMILRRRRWARIALTALLLAATFGSISSWAAGPEVYPIIIATDIVHIIMLGLLWLPSSVRMFLTRQDV